MSDFREPPDLTNPAQLVAELSNLAGGLEQQGEAADSRSAMGSHPCPKWFFNQAAAAMRAAVELIAKYNPPASQPESPVEETPPPAAVEQPKEKRGPGRPPKNPEPVPAAT